MLPRPPAPASSTPIESTRILILLNNIIILLLLSGREKKKKREIAVASTGSGDGAPSPPPKKKKLGRPGASGRGTAVLPSPSSTRPSVPLFLSSDDDDKGGRGCAAFRRRPSFNATPTLTPSTFVGTNKRRHDDCVRRAGVVNWDRYYRRICRR